MESNGETFQSQPQHKPVPGAPIAEKIHPPKKGGWRAKLLFAFSRHQDENSIVFHSYPKFVFCWPILFLGLVGYLWSLVGTPPSALSWVYVLAMTVVLLAISFDMGRNWVAIWSLVVMVFVFCALWLGSVYGVPVFRTIGHWLGTREMDYPVGLTSTISLILAPIFLGMVISVRLNQKWRMTHNEIERFVFWSSSDSFGRGSKQFTFTFPDVLERLLLFSGTITVKTNNGKFLKAIPDVPGLTLKMRKFDRILAAVAMSPHLDEEDDGDHGDADGHDSEDENNDGHD